MIKKIIVTTFLIALAYIFINSTYKTAGGHPSSTGAPGEKTCARTDCHSDASLTFDSPLNKFIFSNPDNTYQLGRTYSISIELTKTDIEKFGFQIVAIDSATQKNVGTWVLTEPSKTHIINGEAPNTDRRYITQTTAGTNPAIVGKGNWNFKWTAPSQNKGTIVFYYVTNATNNNDQFFGDQLFLSNYKIRFSQTGSIDGTKKLTKPKVSISDKNLVIHSENELISAVEVYDLNGRNYEVTENRKNYYTVNTAAFGDGNTILLYKITTDKGTYTGKIWR